MAKGGGKAYKESTIVCEICGKKIPSHEMDDHLFEEHGIMG